MTRWRGQGTFGILQRIYTSEIVSGSIQLERERQLTTRDESQMSNFYLFQIAFLALQL